MTPPAPTEVTASPLLQSLLAYFTNVQQDELKRILRQGAAAEGLDEEEWGFDLKRSVWVRRGPAQVVP